jgi:hypothetical protein
VNWGGGVGIYGQGSNGIGADFSLGRNSPTLSDGLPGSNGQINRYGGGGGSVEDDTDLPGGPGASGVVRIMWDTFAASEFPSTNVSNTGSETEF